MMRTIVLAMLLAGCSTTTGQPLPVAPLELHSADWQNTVIPGGFCDVPADIKLVNGQASIPGGEFGSLIVETSLPALYGDLDGDGTDEAAVRLTCAPEGAGAAAVLAQGYLIFSGKFGNLQLLGIVVAQYHDQPGTTMTAIGRVQISLNEVTSEELWYDEDDPTCCPSGKALTAWTYRGGQLIPGKPQVVPPR